MTQRKSETKEEYLTRVRAYHAKHQEEERAYRASRREEKRAYDAAHREAARGYSATYYYAHWEERRAHRTALKVAALNAYGGARCSCCGETLLEGLSIDHIAGTGADHRRGGGVDGQKIYLWLKKNNYPAGYQVLCMTCNVAKGTSDHCPHQDLKIAWG